MSFVAVALDRVRAGCHAAMLAIERDLPPDARRVTDRQGQPIELAPIRALLARCEARYRPTQTWLFGSRARGDAAAASDWDVLVVVPDDTPEDELDPLVA